MPRTALLALSAALLSACAGAPAAAPPSAPPSVPWPGTIERHGSVREALAEGRSEARVPVAHAAEEHVWALGALADLRGEVTVLDGVPWVSEGRSNGARTRRGPEVDAQATMLFSARVPEWRTVLVERDVAPGELDAYVAAAARRVGLDPSAPFPFRVEGALHDLRLHVVAGECPMRAAALGRAVSMPPFRIERAREHARLFGFHAPGLAGELCHAGSASHVHALLERSEVLTGHVESVGLAKGAALLLPAS